MDWAISSDPGAIFQRLIWKRYLQLRTFLEKSSQPLTPRACQILWSREDSQGLTGKPSGAKGCSGRGGALCLSACYRASLSHACADNPKGTQEGLAAGKRLGPCGGEGIQKDNGREYDGSKIIYMYKHIYNEMVRK